MMIGLSLGLCSTTGMGGGLTFGNLIAGVGDSTMRGSTAPTCSCIGIDGATLDGAGDSWLTHMCLASGQRIARIVNAGDIGAKAQDICDSFDTIIPPRKPTTVFIGGGTNDIEQDQRTPAAFSAIVASTIGKALAANIKPILVSLLPSANAPAFLSLVPQYNTQLRALAQTYGLIYLDLYTFALDVGTGGLRAELSLDGVHPSSTGHRLLGEYAASVLVGRARGEVPGIAASGETDNLVVNPFFAGTPGVNGNAPNWAISGTLPAGATASVVTEAGVEGYMQRLEAVATSTEAIILQAVSNTKWTAGELLDISGLVKKEGSAQSRIWVTASSGFTYVYPYASIVPIGVSRFFTRWRVPTGRTAMEIHLRQMAGTGAIQMGQVKIRNLTRLGLDV